jgi:hypothetical protein
MFKDEFRRIARQSPECVRYQIKPSASTLPLTAPPRAAQNPWSAGVQAPRAAASGFADTRLTAAANSGLTETRSRMSKSAEQNLKNHGRYDPSVHFVLLLILVANVVFAVIHFIRHWDTNPYSSGWVLVLSLAVFIPVFRLRSYPLKVQDRVIRLEERLRLQALAPTEWHSQIYRLTEDQLIGLRFAADDEVVELAKQALEHNLTRKQIKERIQSWRPDNWRV